MCYNNITMKTIKEFDQLLLPSKALGNITQLNMLVELTNGGCYVSELARKLKIGRALLYLHLNKLEVAQLIYSDLKISSDGKALKYYYICSFKYLIDNDLIKNLTKRS